LNAVIAFHIARACPCGVGSPGTSVDFFLSAKSSRSYIYYTFTFSSTPFHVPFPHFSVPFLIGLYFYPIGLQHGGCHARRVA
jgi:hypothetical protein